MLYYCYSMHHFWIVWFSFSVFSIAITFIWIYSPVPLKVYSSVTIPLVAISKIYHHSGLMLISIQSYTSYHFYPGNRECSSIWQLSIMDGNLGQEIKVKKVYFKLSTPFYSIFPHPLLPIIIYEKRCIWCGLYILHLNARTWTNRTFSEFPNVYPRDF